MKTYTYAVVRTQKVEIEADSPQEAQAKLSVLAKSLEPITYPISLISISEERKKDVPKAKKKRRQERT